METAAEAKLCVQTASPTGCLSAEAAKGRLWETVTSAGPIKTKAISKMAAYSVKITRFAFKIPY